MQNALHSLIEESTVALLILKEITGPQSFVVTKVRLQRSIEEARKSMNRIYGQYKGPERRSRPREKCFCGRYDHR